MSSISLSARALAAAGFVAPLVAFTPCASATALQLAVPNIMSTDAANSFQLYSLDLNRQCANALDGRCLPAGPFPVASSPGQIADQAIVLSSANGMTNTPSPFGAGAPVDNVFLTPTGNQGATYSMVGQVGGKFTGDQAARWDIRLDLLQSYLGANDLVFLFDNNQQANGSSQTVSLWGQARIVDAGGATVNGLCFELSGAGGGCADPGANPVPAAGDYLAVGSDYCVDRVSGAVYNMGLATTAAACPTNPAHPQGGYQVENNLSTSSAELAAYSAALNEAAKLAAYGQYFLSVNVRFIGNNAGAEQLWLCSECNVAATDLPEPASLALAAIALLGMSLRRAALVRKW